MQIEYETTWILTDSTMAPDLTNAPPPPDGYTQVRVESPVEAGHTPEPGEAVTVIIDYDPATGAFTAPTPTP